MTLDSTEAVPVPQKEKIQDGDRVRIISAYGYGGDEETEEYAKYVGRKGTVTYSAGTFFVVKLDKEDNEDTEPTAASVYIDDMRPLSPSEDMEEVEDIAPEKAKPMSEALFQEGDNVQIHSRLPSDAIWIPEMDDTLGKVGRVIDRNYSTFRGGFEYSVQVPGQPRPWWYLEGSLCEPESLVTGPDLQEPPDFLEPNPVPEIDHRELFLQLMQAASNFNYAGGDFYVDMQIRYRHK